MRKKYILIFLFFTICIFIVQSQRFNGGFTTGLSLSQIDGDGWSGFNKLGLVAGGFVTTKLSNRLTSQYEVKYVQKGARERFDPKERNVHKTQLEYLEMPVTVNYSIKSDSFLIETGLLLARIVRSKAYDAFGETGLQNPYHKFDFGFIIGASYKLNKHIWFNLRYTYSIIRIRKLEFPGVGWWWYNRGDYNNVMSFSVFYQI